MSWGSERWRVGVVVVGVGIFFLVVVVVLSGEKAATFDLLGIQFVGQSERCH